MILDAVTKCTVFFMVASVSVVTSLIVVDVLYRIAKALESIAELLHLESIDEERRSHERLE